MYHVSAQGTDERMINVHYYYYLNRSCSWDPVPATTSPETTLVNGTCEQHSMLIKVTVLQSLHDNTLTVT